jgi:hypothetical protein
LTIRLVTITGTYFVQSAQPSICTAFRSDNAQSRTGNAKSRSQTEVQGSSFSLDTIYRVHIVNSVRQYYKYGTMTY